MNPEKAEGRSPELQAALQPLLAGLESLSEQIREYNERIENFNQIAAPDETRTPNLHRAKTAHRECGWKGGDSGDSAGEKSLSNEKIKEPT
jgi:hypothetical protein